MSQKTVAIMVRRRPCLAAWSTFLPPCKPEAATFRGADGTCRRLSSWCCSRMIAGASCVSRSRSIPRPPGPYSSFATPSPGTRCLDISSAIVIMFDHVNTIGIQEVLTTPASPWQNAYVERFIGSVRRECLDHVIVLTAAGLRRVLNEYVAYYSRTRTHLGLDKDAPLPRPVAPLTAGRVIAIPQVGGLHHRYERRAT